MVKHAGGNLLPAFDRIEFVKLVDVSNKIFGVVVELGCVQCCITILSVRKSLK